MVGVWDVTGVVLTSVRGVEDETAELADELAGRD